MIYQRKSHKFLQVIYLAILSSQFSGSTKRTTFTCPSAFHKVADDVCLRVFSTARSFCEANEICSNYSKLLNIPLFLMTTAYKNASSLVSRRFAWTGFSRVSDESKLTDSVWIHSIGFHRPVVVEQSELLWDPAILGNDNSSWHAQLEKIDPYTSYLIPTRMDIDEESDVICQLGDDLSMDQIDRHDILKFKFFCNVSTFMLIYESDKIVYPGCSNGFPETSKMECLLKYVQHSCASWRWQIIFPESFLIWISYEKICW